MATIFPREQKAKMLFEKIKENPQACERLMETFYDALGVGDDYEGNGLSAEQFATALFRSYEEKDLTAFLMAICQNSMFDLLRNSFLAPFFYLGYYMEQPVLERALRPVYRRVVVPAAVAICAGILAFGSKLKDELGMVYENISYYELDDVWEGPFVRLALMIAAFLISWAIMFFVPRGKTCLSVIGQNTMPVYMLHRILRDILMFAGIYDYLGDWGWFALFVLICLSICVIYLLVNPKVVNQVNKILTLYTPRLWGRIRRNQAI
jgi:fucose 4-O-acetylase-like acetyltransferase